MKEYVVKFECTVPAETIAAIDKLFQLSTPHCTSVIHVPLPRRHLPSDANASDVPLGEWDWFVAAMENEPPFAEQPIKLQRYQPQDGDGPGWVEYEMWNLRPIESWVES